MATDILHCVKFEFRCPKQWRELRETGEQGVRHCSECNENVHHTKEPLQATKWGIEGKCVALEAEPQRPGPPAVGRVRPPEQMITMGRIADPQSDD